MTRAADADALASAAVDLHGRIDGLVAAAGVFDSASIADVEPDAFSRVLAINLTGVYLTARAALRHMVAQGRRAHRDHRLAWRSQTGGLAAGAAYAASKAGVLALTKSIARFGGPHGITANCVNCRASSTPPMTARLDRTRRASARVAATPLAAHGHAGRGRRARRLPRRRTASAFVHGAHLDVNGGLYMD